MRGSGMLLIRRVDLKYDGVISDSKHASISFLWLDGGIRLHQGCLENAGLCSMPYGSQTARCHLTSIKTAKPLLKSNFFLSCAHVFHQF